LSIRDHFEQVMRHGRRAPQRRHVNHETAPHQLCPDHDLPVNWAVSAGRGVELCGRPGGRRSPTLGEGDQHYGAAGRQGHCSGPMSVAPWHRDCARDPYLDHS
jgi:hypothetical protein